MIKLIVISFIILALFTLLSAFLCILKIRNTATTEVKYTNILLKMIKLNEKYNEFVFANKFEEYPNLRNYLKQNGFLINKIILNNDFNFKNVKISRYSKHNSIYKMLIEEISVCDDEIKELIFENNEIVEMILKLKKPMVYYLTNLKKLYCCKF